MQTRTLAVKGRCFFGAARYVHDLRLPGTLHAQFGALSPEQIVSMVDNMIASVELRLRDRDMKLELTQAAKNLLAERGFDPEPACVPTPDLALMARAFGADGVVVRTPADLYKLGVAALANLVPAQRAARRAIVEPPSPRPRRRSQAPGRTPCIPARCRSVGRARACPIHWSR